MNEEILYYIGVDRKGNEYISDYGIYRTIDFINTFDGKYLDMYKREFDNFEVYDFYSRIEDCDYGHYRGDDLLIDDIMELPKGSIYALTGMELTYEEGVLKGFLKPTDNGLKFIIKDA